MSRCPGVRGPRISFETVERRRELEEIDDTADQGHYDDEIEHVDPG